MQYELNVQYSLTYVPSLSWQMMIVVFHEKHGINRKAAGAACSAPSVQPCNIRSDLRECIVIIQQAHPPPPVDRPSHHMYQQATQLL
jgi:hypothetical protein